MTKFALLIIHTKINIGRAEDGLGYFFFLLHFIFTAGLHKDKYHKMECSGHISLCFDCFFPFFLDLC